MTQNDHKELDLKSVQGSLDELFLLARHYHDSEQFLGLLKFVSNFKRYSPFNAMLVYTQMPGAHYVLPAKQWIEKYGRHPRPDAQPLVMLQPKGPVMFAYDVSQTEGRALPEQLEDPFHVKGSFSENEFSRTKLNCRRLGVEIIEKPMGSTLAGYVRNAANPDHRIGIGRIEHNRIIEVDGVSVPLMATTVLNSNHSREVSYATLTHELAHLFCGHVGVMESSWWSDRSHLDRNTREFEAESVSYIVCQRAGLDTPAVAYLHVYLNEHNEAPSISLHSVFKAVQKIESMRTKNLKVINSM